MGCGDGGGQTLSSRETTSFSRRCFFVWNGFASKLEDRPTNKHTSRQNRSYGRTDVLTVWQQTDEGVRVR